VGSFLGDPLRSVWQWNADSLSEVEEALMPGKLV
jgi:hypothetical protein